MEKRSTLEEDDGNAAVAYRDEDGKRVAPESMAAHPRVAVDAADERPHRIVGADIPEAPREERQETLRDAVDIVDHDRRAPGVERSARRLAVEQDRAQGATAAPV